MINKPYEPMGWKVLELTTGGEKHREMAQTEGQWDGKRKERITVVDSPTGSGPG